MKGLLLAIGATLSAIAILAGAFGAHGLKSRLDPAALELWETAARYLMYSGLGITLVALANLVSEEKGFATAGWLLLAGGLIFSSTVGILALGGPRWLGAVTPIGGLLLIAGFLMFAWTSIRL